MTHTASSTSASGQTGRHEHRKPPTERPCARVANGTRTRDHRDHNPGLYQLSYRHRAPIILAAPRPTTRSVVGVSPPVGRRDSWLGPDQACRSKRHPLGHLRGECAVPARPGWRRARDRLCRSKPARAGLSEHKGLDRADRRLTRPDALRVLRPGDRLVRPLVAVAASGKMGECRREPRSRRCSWPSCSSKASAGRSTST